MMEKKLSTDRGGLGDEDYLNAVDRCQPQTLGQVMSADFRVRQSFCTKCREAGRRETRSRLDALA